MYSNRKRPKVLDLFCGAGGASEGYYRAGFDVIGVDIDPQPNYPFAFIQADAMDFPLYGLDWTNGGFDLVHASPPCQGYTWGTRKGREEKFGRKISEVRQMLESFPYVIENVPNAHKDMMEPIRLCGTQFGLPLLKHRLFEADYFDLPEPLHNRHTGSVGSGDYVTVAGHGGNNKTGNFQIGVWQKAMDIDWMHTQHDLAEAIPPAYTEYIGRKFKEVY